MGNHPIAITGSRSCPAAMARCRRWLDAQKKPSSLVVGCAQGVDKIARHWSSTAGVPLRRITAASFSGSCGARLAQRSRAVAGAVADGGLLAAFPAGPCPAGVSPVTPWPGLGAGTWGTVATACAASSSVFLALPHGQSPPDWFHGDRVAGGWLRKAKQCLLF